MVLPQSTIGPRKVLLEDKTLFHHAVSRAGLNKGWDKVRKNRGAAGGDNITIDMFSRDANGWIGRLRRSLLSGEYRPGPLRKVDIPKPGGRGPRTLNIPCVSDRVVQSAVTQVLMPRMDEEFEPSSFAYRTGRSVVQAVARVSQAQRDGYNWIVDADIHDFFGSVPHDGLMERWAESVSPGPLSELVMTWLTHATPSGIGLAQGSPLSPLLANLYLDRLDERYAGRNLRFVRFADDFVILARSKSSADQALKDVSNALTDLGLALNMDKTQIQDFDRGLRFLGHLFVRSLVTKTSPEEADDTLSWMRKLARTDAQVEKDAASEKARDAFHETAGFSPGFRVLYVYEAGRTLGIRNQAFSVSQADPETGESRELIAIHHDRVDRIEIGPRARLEPQALDLALATDTLIAHVNGYGETTGISGQSLASRAGRHLAQARMAFNEEEGLELARLIVRGRLRTQRAVLRRLSRDRDVPRAVTESLHVINRTLGRGKRSALADAKSTAELMGFEGEAAAGWWRAISALSPASFRFSRRIRPPDTPDMPNIILNFLSSLLARDVTVAVIRAGLHPGFGVLHASQDNRNACAYDLMEVFRAHFIGGLAVYLFNKKVLQRSDFAFNKDGSARLKSEGARALIRAYEKRMDRRITSPRSGRRITWRALMIEQAFDYAAHAEGHRSFEPYEIGY